MGGSTKKIFWILGLLFLALSIAACGANTLPADNSDPWQEEQVEQPNDEEAPGEGGNQQDTDHTFSAQPDAVKGELENDQMKLQIGENIFTATLEKNSSTEALKEMLKSGPITIDMQDYGRMEKVGAFSTSLPRNDQQTTTEPGDLILYQGNAFVIYYAPNSWNFTRLGKINGVTQKELKEALGKGDVKVTLSLD